jgi:surface antigen
MRCDVRTGVTIFVVLLLAACSQGPAGSVDPHLYDANGNVVVTPVAQAAPACRPVEIDGTVGGQPQKVMRTACRGSDGTWRFND